MPGDAGSAIIKIKTSIDWGDLSSLESKIDALEKTTHTIKVKVEAAEGQKGLDKYLKDIDKLGQDAFRKTSGGAKNASKDIQNVGSGAKDVADNFKKAGKSANVLSASSKQIKKDSDEYVTALKAANHTIDGMKKNLSKMQDAGFYDSDSYDDWKNYNKQLEKMIALRDKLGDPHGNQTNNSFNRNFKEITSSAERSLQEITRRGDFSSELTNGYKTAQKEAAKLAQLEQKNSEKEVARQAVAREKEQAAQQKSWDSRIANIEKQEAAWNKQLERAGKQYEAEIKEYDRLNSEV